MKTTLSRVGLLIIGDELLLGRRVDKHFPWALAYFSTLGVDLRWVNYIGDEEALLTESFRAIRERGEVCFSFGGIGATPDDLTRQAMAAAHDRPLVRHPEAVRMIEDQFGREAYPNRILMAELPEAADLIPNAFNNIPGFSIGTIFCLPGFPEMAWPMLEWVVATRFDTRVGPRQRFAAVTVVDVRESELIGLLEDAQRRFPEVKVSSLPRFPQRGRWLVELGLRGPERLVGQAMNWLRGELEKRGLRSEEMTG
ncbi:MAG: competence/damage-inducible protein A [Desulfofustis sp.]|nr:competence/damage-inducible protein A [Desulfofustis sp.]